MRIALTSFVPDAVDVLEAHLEFHLGAGVDVVVVAENGSTDDTRAILERYVRRGLVHAVRAPADATELAHAAATKAGADWVIESDMSEFWWPRAGSLKELLGSISPRYGAVQALVRYFVPVKDTTEPFTERMIYRLAQNAPITDPESRWRPMRRLVRRASAASSTLSPVRGWYPIEVLRFPLEAGAADAYDEDALRRGVEEGVLHVDTRLRDALWVLADGRRPDFPRPDVIEEARFALEVASLGETDVLQTRARLDELEARLAAVESTFTEALKRKLRTLRRRS